MHLPGSLELGVKKRPPPPPPLHAGAPVGSWGGRGLAPRGSSLHLDDGRHLDGGRDPQQPTGDDAMVHRLLCRVAVLIVIIVCQGGEGET